MKPGEKDLVRVQSEGELRPGMTVWVLPCRACGRRDAKILMHKTADSWGHPWRVAGGCGKVVELSDGSIFNGYIAHFDLPIAEGRLFRLRELPASDESTTEKRREVVA
jgi:hypothetical protein